MLLSLSILFLSIIGSGLWLSAIIGFGLLTAPLLHRELSSEDAGRLAGRILERAHLLGWYGGITLLLSIILHSLYISEGPAAPPFLLWSIPVILATSIWWVSWKKILPQTEALRIAMIAAKSSESDEEALEEGQVLFAKMHSMSVGMWKVCILFLLISLFGLAWTYTSI